MSTKVFCWLAFGAIVSFDVGIAVSHGVTISEALRVTNAQYPVLGFSWGILTGHLFWPQKIRDNV